MITRVTMLTMMRSSASNMTNASNELARLQDKASSQKQITRPSDDPAGTAAALQVRASQSANVQYSRNTQDGNEWLTTVDSSLSDVSALLQRAKVLTLTGANDGSMSQSSKDAIATELDTIKDSLLKASNAQYQGRTVFAGNSDTGAAFDSSYAYSGGSGTVERRIGPATTIRVDADGAAIFGTGTNSVFAQIDSIAADLRAGTNVSPRLDALDSRLNTVLAAQATSGARQTTLIAAASSQANDKVNLEAQRSGIEDVDIGEIIMELKMQETVYQGALAVTARTLQPTLMDFLK